jgi:hypothetical protein
MMRKLLPILFITMVLVFGFFITNAGAVGLGGYINYGNGSVSWSVENAFDTWDDDADFTVTGYGFVMDSNVARNSLFNYRLQIGFENWSEDLESDVTYELSGLVLTQDFGFGIVRTPAVRLWLGPEVRLAYVTGTPENESDLEMYIFCYGIGPVFGANFHMGSAVSLSVKAGYLYEGFVGAGDWANTMGYSSDYDEVYWGASSQFFINFSILFRIGDAF